MRDLRLSRFYALLWPNTIWWIQSRTKDIRQEVQTETEGNGSVAKACPEHYRARGMVASAEAKADWALPILWNER